MVSRFTARVGSWSRHPHAPRYLAAVSFAESSFFPVPPDVLLAPLCLARPKEARFLALWTTLWSVAGGLAAFALAAWATEPVMATLTEAGFGSALETAERWFAAWGFLAVVISGFSPVPYKIFAFAAGAMGMTVPGFVLASILGRGARFVLVAEIARGGAALRGGHSRRVRIVGWSVAALLAIVLLLG